MRLTFLLTSDRVPAGLLTRAGWQAVETAHLVLAADPAWVDALHAEGVAVEPLAAPYDRLHAAVRDRSGGVVVAMLDADAVGDLPAEVRAGAEILPSVSDVEGARLLDVVRVMDRLRTECPWDREQTHRSLATYLLEETYETLEAIETGDLAHLREELGDLLLQVLFHARIAAEGGPDGFDIDDVAVGIRDKLVHRHPHVFAGLAVADAAEVDRNWNRLKAAEKKRTSPLDGIPATLPALAYADKVLGRLAGTAPAPEIVQAPEDWGARALELVAEARARGLDPEQELREAVRRLIARSTRPAGPGPLS